MKNISFIGSGNMATAIISGIAKSNLEAKLYAFDIDQTKLISLEQFDVTACQSIENAVCLADYIIISVKPQNFTDVLPEIKKAITPQKVIISIAAGITAEYITNQLGKTTKVIQTMPNTPLLLGYGATAISRNSNVDEKEFEFAKSIFNCAGITQDVPNDKMNEIIAINGSSPAFIYEFARCFVEYGKGAGIDEQTCLKLFSQTLIGSANMMMGSDSSIDDLIKMVSSKGGTTIAGLESFKASNLQGVVQSACESCVKRAYELSK